MRHSIHILFGQSLAPITQLVRVYIQKYGEGHAPYFTDMRWSSDENGGTTLSVVNLKVKDSGFIADYEERYDISLEKVQFEKQELNNIVSYFTSIQQKAINIDNQGSHSALHYCLYFPLYESEAWDEVKKCISVLKAVNLSVDIDLFGFGDDLAKVLDGDDKSIDNRLSKKTTSETIRQAIELKKKPDNHLAHFVVMQNRQAKGVSLNLSTETLIKIVGEFAMLCVECYDEFWGLTQSNSELQGLGLSVLSLDKYYYVEYLLHNAYLYALEREGIKGVDKIESVDVVLATNKAQDILKDKIRLLSDFYNKEIKQRINNKKSNDVIIQEITPLFNDRIARLATDSESFIIDGKLSIPVKRAIFSALLGEDDELFDNVLFDEEPLILDDIDAEGLKVYLDANNALLDVEEQKQEALLSHNGEPVYSLLPEIKKLRTKIIRSTGYIRTLEKEVEELITQVDNIEESQKSLVDGNFYVFGEQKFRLLPDIQEIPLQETYVAHTPSAESIDLRGHFSQIKNQGQQGSCTAHALTAIYEYILKSNKAERTDLSEAFLYYNARQKNGKQNQDDGSRYDLAIESLVEVGICEEALMPYDPGDYTTPPTQEAFDNALTRRVRKAVNVKREINDLRSALEEGYPIAISATLYDSFGKGTKGMVSLPTEEETLHSEHGHHAMVICGYSDENKLFVVRNSWGTDFGDDGYCYIPYSYITDENLVCFAAIITEVETYSAKVMTRRTALSFGDDVKMRYAIKQNALKEEHRLLANLQGDYRQLKLQYNQLHELVLNPHVQKSLSGSTEVRLNHEKEVLAKEYIQAGDDMDEQLAAFDVRTRRKSISYSIGSLVVFMVLRLFDRYVLLQWLQEHASLISGVALIVCVVAVGVFILMRIRKREQVKAELQEICDQCNERVMNKELEQNKSKLRMHFAGMILVGNSKIELGLSQKYQFMRSFFTNLNTWYTIESDSLKKMDDKVSAPFLSIINNETLDDDFEQQRDELTKDISFCRIFSEGYQLSKEGVEAFQATVKQVFCKELLASINDFSIYDYLTNPQGQRFTKSKTVKELLSDLANKSDVFIQHSKSPNTSNNIFIYIRNEDEKKKWQLLSRPYFTTSPSSHRIVSPLKLIMTQMEELTIDEIYI